MHDKELGVAAAPLLAGGALLAVEIVSANAMLPIDSSQRLAFYMYWLVFVFWIGVTGLAVRNRKVRWALLGVLPTLASLLPATLLVGACLGRNCI